MARWDPGAEDRLRRAALELYSEHGYDAVTIAQIAERAGLTRRSYFRYFADKREVLFGGSERLPPAIAEAISAADDSSTPFELVVTALKDVGVRLLQAVDGTRERREIIAQSAELQERERTKTSSIAQAITEALIQRQVSPTAAHLIGPIATEIFRIAFDRCIARDDPSAFPSCVDDVVTELAALTAPAGRERLNRWESEPS